MSSPTILLIEAEPVLSEILAFRMELMGYRVDRAATGEAAFASIANEVPSLIVVDLLLGGEDALTLAERLSNDQRTHGIPVMAISSRAGLDDVQRAYAAGVKEYLVAPFDPTVLEQKLERLAPLSV